MISIRILFLTIVFSIFEVSSYTGGNTYAQNARTFEVGMTGCGTEISAPSSQIFNADLQIAVYIPESIGYQILSFTIGFGILTRVSIFRIKSGQTVCSGYKDARAKIVLQSCIPSQHRKNLHFSFLVRIGDDVYVQVA